MDNIFLLAAIIAVSFFLFKFLEMRFILKEGRPLKLLMRESLQVYISSVIGLFIAGQFKVIQNTVNNTIGGANANVNVFVDSPGF
jgi:uncharacterized membrane protein YcfT